MGAWDMATPFDAFLQTQGKMQANDAQRISNEFNLAKLSQMQQDQALEAKSRQLGMEIARTNLAKQANPAPNAVTLANLSEVPDAALESAGERAFAPKEIAVPATVTPPKQSETLARLAADQRKQADQFGALGDTKRQMAYVEEARKTDDNLYRTQAEERKADVEKKKEAASRFGAVNSQESLDAAMEGADPEQFKKIAGLFPLGLDGKAVWDGANGKAAKGAQYIARAAMDASKQAEFEHKALLDQIAAERAKTTAADLERKTAKDDADDARRREGDKNKKDAIAVQRLKADPFGILSSQPDVTVTTDGSRAPAGITLDQKSGRMYKDGLDVTDQMKTGAVTTADPAALKAALGSNVHGDAFLKLVPPALQATVLQVAEGRGPMPPQGRNDPTNKAIRMMVNQYDPNYREGDYASGAAAEKAFTAGRLGSSVRSFNVATQHLDTLQKAADALENGDIPAFNTVGNYIAKQTGQPAPTDFNATKRIVADEIVKAIVGGQNALADRQDAADAVNAANSPAQLAGVIKKYKELMAGQLVGLEKQYEASTKKKDFRERFLTPEALAEVAKTRRAGDNPPKKTADILSAADAILAGK